MAVPRLALALLFVIATARGDPAGPYPAPVAGARGQASARRARRRALRQDVRQVIGRVRRVLRRGWAGATQATRHRGENDKDWLQELFKVRRAAIEDAMGGKPILEATWKWEKVDAAYDTLTAYKGQALAGRWKAFMQLWVEEQKRDAVAVDTNFLGCSTFNQSIAKPATGSAEKTLSQEYADAFSREMTATSDWECGGSTVRPFVNRYMGGDGVWTFDEKDCGGPPPAAAASGAEQYAVVVLGASGAGKTRSTKSALCKYFRKNGWTLPGRIVTVDGGRRIRELSQVWTELQCLRDFFSVLRLTGRAGEKGAIATDEKADFVASNALGGFEDAFKLLKKTIDGAKDNIYDRAKSGKESMAIIDTGTMDLWFYTQTVSNLPTQTVRNLPKAGKGLVQAMAPFYTKITELAQESSYKVGVIVVNTARSNVWRRMVGRQLAEGKQAGMSQTPGPIGDTWQLAYNVAANMLAEIYRSAEMKDARAHYTLVVQNSWMAAHEGQSTMKEDRCDELPMNSTNALDAGSLWVPDAAERHLEVRLSEDKQRMSFVCSDGTKGCECEYQA